MTAFEGLGPIRRTLEKREGFQLESFGRATSDTEGRASEATLKALDEILATPERFSLAHLQKAADYFATLRPTINRGSALLQTVEKVDGDATGGLHVGYQFRVNRSSDDPKVIFGVDCKPTFLQPTPGLLIDRTVLSLSRDGLVVSDSFLRIPVGQQVRVARDAVTDQSFQIRGVGVEAATFDNALFIGAPRTLGTLVRGPRIVQTNLNGTGSMWGDIRSFLVGGWDEKLLLQRNSGTLHASLTRVPHSVFGHAEVQVKNCGTVPFNIKFGDYGYRHK